jgi:hypothetical protein
MYDECPYHKQNMGLYAQIKILAMYLDKALPSVKDRALKEQASKAVAHARREIGE